LPDRRFQFPCVALLDLYLIYLFSVIEKKWTVNGAIREIDKVGCYYLDPGTQSESTRCLAAVTTRQFALLWGARASGKTTRLFWLQEKLISMGYQAL
jgi:hypothetical protein